MKKLVLTGWMVLGAVSIAVCQVSTDEQLATRYYQNQQYAKAIPYYQKVYSNHPAAYNYHNYLDCLIQTKNYKSAEKLVKKQLHEDKGNLVLWIDLGNLFELQENTKQAKESYEKAIHKLTPDREQILGLGQAFEQKQLWSYALETYQKGKKLLNGQYPFLFETGNVYKNMGNIAAMTDCYLDALKISPTYIQSVQDALQISVGDNANSAQNADVKKELIKYVQRYTGNDIYAELFVWLMVQQKDYAGALVQVKALDKRRHQGGWGVLNLARTCAADNVYQTAIDAYQYVINLGTKGSYYVMAKSEQLQVMYRKLIDGGKYSHQDLLELQAKYKQAMYKLGLSQSTIPVAQNLARIDGFYLTEPDSAIAILNKAIAMPDIPTMAIARCRMELADVLVAAGRVWQASLTYSKVQDAFRNDPIGEEARLKNAEVYFYTGNFKWAKAELDILKAATSKPTANDAMALSLLISDNSQDSASMLPLKLFARAMYFDFSNKEDSAAFLLDSIGNLTTTASTLNEEILLMRAKIAVKKADYANAVTYYLKEIETYPTGLLPDKALFLLAQLEDNTLNNTSKATEYYKKIILNYPGSYYVEQARGRYRQLSKTDAAPAMPN